MNIFHCILLLLVVTCVNSAKILAIFSVPSRSHHILGESLLKGLAAKGHEVTMLSTFKSKNVPKNYKDISLPELLDVKQEHLPNMIKNIRQDSLFEKMKLGFKFFSAVEEAFYNHTKVKKLMSSENQFDLAIVSLLGNDALLAVAQRLAKYTIVFSPGGTNPPINDITKNPAPSSYVPNMFPFDFPEEMNFIERAQNMFASFLISPVLCFIHYNQNNVLKKLSLDTSIKEAHNRVSLIFLNTHYSIESTRPYVPQMIQVGGLHIQDPKPLTGDLKRFMDDAKDGVILFSLGSNANSSDLDQETVSGILKCFSKLPYQILWKFEKNNVLNLPQNVKISDWLPQRDLLAHKNMKAFITHGGLLSTMEAVYHGVPMIGIPLFGDQIGNVNDGVVKGYAIAISPSDLSEDTLCKAVEEITKNPKYSKNIENRSKIFRDQPMKPLDKAVYWVEYVLRHNGAFHLKTSATKLYWFQIYLLDVAAVILILILLSVCIVRKVCQCCCKSFCCKSSKPTTTKEKRKTKKSKIA